MSAAFNHVALHVCDPHGNAVAFSWGQPLGPGAEDMKL